MKAKSKVLLGLIVALAMMVFAVPAFAEVTFTVSGPEPDSVVVMRDASATTTETDKVKLTITEATSAKDDEYTVYAKVDSNAEAEAGTATVVTAGTPVEYEYTTPATLTKGNHTITFRVAKTEGAQDTLGSRDVEKALTVKVIDRFTAELRGVGIKTESGYAREVEKGRDSYISAYSDASTATYKWQKSDKLEEANKADSTKWTDIGKTSAELGTADDLDGKYVRCLVTNDGETVVASPAAIPADASDYAVKLTVKDTSAITLDETKMVDATYFVGQTSPTDLEVTATGGVIYYDSDYHYKWFINGEEDKSATTNKHPVDVSKAGTYEYYVEVTDDTHPEALKATSKTVKITVNDTPVVKMENAVNEKPATYGAGLEPTTGVGVGEIVVPVADKDKDLVLKPVIENAEGKIRSIIWNNVDPGETHTVKAADIKTGATQTVTVNFNGINKPLTYTVTLKVSSGTIKAGTTGGIFTQKDDNVSVRPEYTVTLPKGTVWKNDVLNIAAGAEIPGTYYDSNIPSGLTVKLKNKLTKTTDPLVFYFEGKSEEKPFVEDLTLTIKADALAKAEGTGTPEAVILPVSPDNGFKVTKSADKSLVTMTKPEKDTQGNTHSTPYTGSAITATLEPSAVAKEKGLTADDITNIRYYASEDTAKKTPITEPKDADTYTVVCDIKESKSYSAAKDVVLEDQLKITPVTLDETNADKYLEMDPQSVVYDGNNKSTTVKFKDGLTGTGEVDKTVYRPAGSSPTYVAPVVPNKVGKYDVYVTTKNKTPAEKTRNIANATEPVKVGVFEITKTQPTADLYKLDPAEVKYDGEPHEANVVKADDKAGDVDARHYFAEGSEKELEGKPTEAGKYTVKVDTKDNDNYAAAKMLEVGTFTIKPETPAQQDIWMIGHVQDYGWGEKGDGKAVKLEAGKAAQVGTTGLSKRVEAVTILVPADYTVEGFAHIQDLKDRDIEPETDTSYITNMSDIPEGYKAYRFGTTGRSKRVEAVNIGIKDADGKYVEGFEYATHVQNQGWLGSVRNGSFSGSRGQSLRMEAIRFYYDDQVRKPTDIDAETK